MSETFHSDEEAKRKLYEGYRTEREECDAVLEKEIAEKRKSSGIPTNDEIIALIPSKAVRDHLVKIGHEFSERDRELLRRYLAPADETEFESIFEKGRYVSVPHPFRRGDIVAAYGYAPVFSPHEHKGEYSLGVMRSFYDNAAWQDWDTDVKTRLCDFTDFSDVATTVEFLQDDGSFSHNHPNPMELEFASDVQGALPKDSLRTTLLEVASELLRGEGSIELYEMYKKSYASSPEHLIELLKKLYGNLCEYTKDFADFRKLYFPSDSGEMQSLNAAQKKQAEEMLNCMSIDVWRIKNNTEDLTLPFAALSDKKKRGTLYKKITDEQKETVSPTLNLIFKETEQVLLSIDDFTKLPDSPRKQFYQKKVEKCVKRLKSLATKIEGK